MGNTFFSDLAVSSEAGTWSL